MIGVGEASMNDHLVGTIAGRAVGGAVSPPGTPPSHSHRPPEPSRATARGAAESAPAAARAAPLAAPAPPTTELAFHVDREAGLLIVEVVDQESGTVVRSIPLVLPGLGGGASQEPSRGALVDAKA